MSEPQAVGTQWDIRVLWKSWIAIFVWSIFLSAIITFSFGLIVEAFRKQPLTNYGSLTAVFAFAIYRGVRGVRRKVNEIGKGSEE